MRVISNFSFLHRETGTGVEAAIVESVERQKSRQRAHLAGMAALFASLQSRAFNGEL